MGRFEVGTQRLAVELKDSVAKGFKEWMMSGRIYRLKSPYFASTQRNAAARTRYTKPII